MPWEYILSGAGWVGLSIIIIIIFAKKLVEKSVENQFDTRLEGYKSDRNKELESQKSELDIWASLRKDILTEVWEAHRSAIKLMGGVLQTIQEPFALESYSDMENSLRNKSLRAEIADKLGKRLIDLRQVSHSNVHLISEDAAAIEQKFFDNAFKLFEWLSSVPKNSEMFDSADVMTNLKAVSEGLDEASEFIPLLVSVKNERKAYYQFVVAYFGLEEIMPWVVRPSTAEDENLQSG
jgi:hypothetical protein